MAYFASGIQEMYLIKLGVTRINNNSNKKSEWEEEIDSVYLNLQQIYINFKYLLFDYCQIGLTNKN